MELLLNIVIKIRLTMIRYASETITHTLDELKDIEKVKVE